MALSKEQKEAARQYARSIIPLFFANTRGRVNVDLDFHRTKEQTSSSDGFNQTIIKLLKNEEVLFGRIDREINGATDDTSAEETETETETETSAAGDQPPP